MKNLYLKLLQAQKKIHAIPKDSDNQYFKSKYFDINALLAQIKPVLNDLGVLVTQPLSMKEGRATLVTAFTDTETGEVLHQETVLPEMNDPQKFGGVVTYYRRYALVSFLCCEAEDDDGNSTRPMQVATTQPVKAQPVSTSDPVYEPQPTYSAQEYKDCPNKCGNRMKAGSKFPVCYKCHMAKKDKPLGTAVSRMEGEVDLDQIPF